MRAPWLIGLVLLAVGSGRAAQEPALAVVPVDTDLDAATPVRQSRAELATLTRIEALEQSVAQGADAEAVQRQVIELKQAANLERLRLLAEECRLTSRLAEAELAEQELARLLAPAPLRHVAMIDNPEGMQALDPGQVQSTPAAKRPTPLGPSSSEEGEAR